jgi:hypothetical protein
MTGKKICGAVRLYEGKEHVCHRKPGHTRWWHQNKEGDFRWQNAAESLPAQPEQDTDEKDESILPGPVAPVEATAETEPLRCTCGARLPIDISEWPCKACVGNKEEVEPKPTPDTGRVMCRDHEWLDEKPCPYCADVKPQPDSSSIPEADEESRIAIMADRQWIAGARFGYGCGQFDDQKALDLAIEGRQKLIRDEPKPDSSSISTEPQPEPLVNQVVLNSLASGISGEVKELHRLMAVELKQWRKWAKGQSNGR